MKKDKNTEIRTKMFTALAAVSKDENDMDYVQILPDDPCTGMVKPFRGLGYGQLLNNGTFDFTRIRRKRRRPALKLCHSSLSFGKDGIDRFYFHLPSSRRREFEKLFRRDAKMLYEFIRLAVMEP